ncbi:MAG: filamentous hemagglutinin family protein, partial [Verrucomicrobiota bacterium]
RLVAGADLTAADFHAVRPLANLATGTGSLLLGTNATVLTSGTNNNRSTVIPNFFQVIRTGTGDINIAAGRDVELLNPLAAIYTAGTQTPAMANFDLPILDYQGNSPLGSAQLPYYPAQYSFGGGNVAISAQNDITHLVLKSGVLIADSTRELTNNWLYRRGYVNPATGQFDQSNALGEIESTSWWVDFSNFFEGVGALGGGNVALTAGRDVSNVDAVVPTNARMPKGTPNASALVELGGGNLVVRAGRDIDGGVYYVERGQGNLVAGNSIHTNTTRAALTQTDLNALPAPDPVTWLPTTLFVGKASFNVAARGNLLLGPVANPFLLPQGINNSFYEKTYFSTYAPTSAITVNSLVSDVTLKAAADGGAGSLLSWLKNVLLLGQKNTSQSQPWLRLAETSVTPFATVAALMPPTLRATAFSGDVNLVGSLTLAPASRGTVEFAAIGSINGFQPNSLNSILVAASVANPRLWGSATINLSDADPAGVPGIATPLALAAASTGGSGQGGTAGSWAFTPSAGLLDTINRLFAESGSSEGTHAVIQAKQALHAAGPLHAGDPESVRLYAAGGNLSGLTLFAGKAAQIIAAHDLTDVALYLQNNATDDLTRVIAGRDIVAFNPNSRLRLAAQTTGNALINSGGKVPGPGSGNPTAGDIQLGGPGTIELLAGRNFDLGVGTGAPDGTAAGLTTIGNTRNPNLPFDGASVIVGAGLGVAAMPDPTAFNAKFLDPVTASEQATRYLPVLRTGLGLAADTDNAMVFAAFDALPAERRAALALDVFYLVLRDAGREHNDPDSAGFKFQSGLDAITALFPGPRSGDISLTSRAIKTTSGGDISLYAPGGQLTVGFDIAGQSADQGILTEHGGDISIFTQGGVNVGTSRIFTLRGGNEIIWASTGNIAAGASSKTVQSAPPTRVLIDPQSGDVKTDLAGLATGGGIGVLATVTGVPPGDVDLIAPTGTIDAGDAGIRSSGRLNVAAVQVLNASNIQSGGASTGVPAPPAAPSLGGLAATTQAANSNTTGAGNEAARAQAQAQARLDTLPSLITVEVLGYGGGSGDTGDPEEKKDPPATPATNG